ncbi:MAG: tetraacyldisaccharide 4'-kinase [bacterium]|nr:tetraacyldisaccharide 4'-kinase [bacterium]
MRLYFYLITHHKKLWVFPFWLILYFLSLLYRQFILFRRRKGYEHQYPDAYIISVGNITTGGTGKTEAAAYLSRILSPEIRTAIILRGYRGTRSRTPLIVGPGSPVRETGDEALLLSEKTTSLVIVSRKKRAGVELALQKGYKFIILDDAFQHWDLDRDYNLVLIDYTNPFGNGHLLPAGILREPLSSLSDANAFFISKCEKKINRRNDLIRTIRLYHSAAPIFVSRYKFKGVALKGQNLSLRKIKGKRLVVFSGIGNTKYFIHQVREHLSPKSMKVLAYPDHHSYTRPDIDRIRQYLEHDYDYCLCTEKDAVKTREFGFHPLVFRIELSVQQVC